MTVVLDTSAVMAVVLGEPDAEALLDVMTDSAGDLVISAVTLVELSIVAEARLGAAGTADVQRLLDRLSVRVVPVDRTHVTAAVRAWRRFGKGHHPAGLNLGDCFSYAMAAVEGAPLLFKGRDFAQTDVRAAR